MRAADFLSANNFCTCNCICATYSTVNVNVSRQQRVPNLVRAPIEWWTFPFRRRGVLFWSVRVQYVRWIAVLKRAPVASSNREPPPPNRASKPGVNSSLRGEGGPSPSPIPVQSSFATAPSTRRREMYRIAVLSPASYLPKISQARTILCCTVWYRTFLSLTN